MIPDRDSAPPPAGGFGEAQSGQRFGPIRPEPKPPLSLPHRVLRAVLSLIGVAALVVAGVTALALLFVGIRYVRMKTVDTRRAESMNALGEIAKQATNTFADRGTLCPSARTASQPTDFEADVGWTCLGFEMVSPHAYRYDYQSNGTSFVATATPNDGKDMIVREIRGRVVDGHVVVDLPIRER